MATKKTKKTKKPSKVDDALRSRGWITVTDATELTGLHWTTLYRYVRAGKLDSKKVGAATYIQKSQLATVLGPDIAQMIGLSGTKKTRAASAKV